MVASTRRISDDGLRPCDSGRRELERASVVLAWVRSWSPRRLLHFSQADAIVVAVFGVAMCAEVVFLRAPHRPPPLAADAVSSMPSADAALFDVALFDAAFGPISARYPSARWVDSARSGCLVPRQNDYFFSRGTFREESPPPWHHPMDSHMRAGFSMALRALGERSLSCRAERAQRFRFLWERVSGTRTITVTLPTDLAFAASVHLSGDAPRLLSTADEREFVAAFERAAFWSMPTFKDAVGLDGESWVVEARVGAHYHVVDRWSPPPSAFRDLGVIFMRLARLPVDAGSAD